jgi:NTE family protein
VLLGTQTNLVICLNPMTSRHRGGVFEPTGPIASFIRGSSRHRLEREMRALRQAGKRVLEIEPKAEDVKAMGYKYMSGKRRAGILSTAVRTTTTALRTTELGRALHALAEGAEGGRGAVSAAR